MQPSNLLYIDLCSGYPTTTADRSRTEAMELMQVDVPMVVVMFLEDKCVPVETYRVWFETIRAAMEQSRSPSIAGLARESFYFFEFAGGHERAEKMFGDMWSEEVSEYFANIYKAMWGYGSSLVLPQPTG